MHCLPPGSGPSSRQVALAAVRVESGLRKVCGFRCGFATSQMPWQQSQHCTHWSCSVPKSMRLSEEFVELVLGPPIFFGQTT